MVNINAWRRKNVTVFSVLARQDWAKNWNRLQKFWTWIIGCCQNNKYYWNRKKNVDLNQLADDQVLANECGNVTYGFIKPEDRFGLRTAHGQPRDVLITSLARLPSSTGKATCSLLNKESIMRYWIPIQGNVQLSRIMTRVYGHFHDWSFGHCPSPDVTTLTAFWRLELPSYSGDTQ